MFTPMIPKAILLSRLSLFGDFTHSILPTIGAFSRKTRSTVEGDPTSSMSLRATACSPVKSRPSAHSLMSAGRWRALTGNVSYKLFVDIIRHCLKESSLFGCHFSKGIAGQFIRSCFYKSAFDFKLFDKFFKIGVLNI